MKLKEEAYFYLNNPGDRKCDHLIKVTILVSNDGVGVRQCSSLLMRYEIIGAISAARVFSQLEVFCDTQGSGRAGRPR